MATRLPREVALLTTVSCVARRATCEAGGMLRTGEATLLSSTDGGRSWVGSALGIGNGSGISSVSCATSSRCWAATSQANASLLGTADGGDVWQSVGFGGASTWGEISCPTATVCVAATNGVLVETRSNGGVGPRTGQAPPAPGAPRGAVRPVLGAPTTPGVSVDSREAEEVAHGLWRELQVARHFQDPRALGVVESGPALAVDAAAASCAAACIAPPPPPSFGVWVVVPHETTWPARFVADAFHNAACNAPQPPCDDVFVAVQARPGAPWKINLIASFSGQPVGSVPPFTLAPPPFSASTLVGGYARLLTSLKRTGTMPAGTVFIKGPFTTGLAGYLHFTEAEAARSGYSYTIRYTPLRSPLYQVETRVGPLSCGVVAWEEIDTPLPGLRLVQLGDRSTWVPSLAPGTYRRIVRRGLHMNCFIPANMSATAPDHKVYVLAYWAGFTRSLGYR